MSELSFMGKLIKAMAKAKLEHVGMELSYFDVVELLGELGLLKIQIAELEKAQRWIPVNEPPKESGEYFTLSDLTYYKGCAGTSMYDKSINHWWDDGTVTHWMKVPKLPKKEREE